VGEDSLVAGNPSNAQRLNLEREITELQSQFSAARGKPISFAFLPGIRLDELPKALSEHAPTILHISAHGENASLTFSNFAGEGVALDGRALLSFLPFEQPPQLIYLNACNSKAMAKELVSRIAMAIGTTAPITNGAARASAVCFYGGIIAGQSIAWSFEASRNMLEALQRKEASSYLFSRPDTDPANRVLYSSPRLIADFVDAEPKPDRDGNYAIRFGLAGCPDDTTQVLFLPMTRRLLGGLTKTKTKTTTKTKTKTTWRAVSVKSSAVLPYEVLSGWMKSMLGTYMAISGYLPRQLREVFEHFQSVQCCVTRLRPDTACWVSVPSPELSLTRFLRLGEKMVPNLINRLKREESEKNRVRPRSRTHQAAQCRKTAAKESETSNQGMNCSAID
jgi:hypothetical protein